MLNGHAVTGMKNCMMSYLIFRLDSLIYKSDRHLPEWKDVFCCLVFYQQSLLSDKTHISLLLFSNSRQIGIWSDIFFR